MVEVPLDFTFPFYGQNFTTSFMFSNGVVMFVPPNTNSAYGLCCDAPDVEGILNGTNNSNYNYILNRNMNALNFTISPFLTDLIQRNGQGKFYIQVMRHFKDTSGKMSWSTITGTLRIHLI